MLCATLIAPAAAAAPGDYFVGWACGGVDAEGGILLATTNGADWSRQGVGQLPAVDLGGMASSDAGDVWVVGNVEGAYAAVYHSPDYGASWSRQGDAASLPSNDLRKVCVVGTQVVWAVGHAGSVIRTVDAGATWTTVPVTGYVNALQGVAAIDGQTAWVSGSSNDVGQCGLFKTANGGMDWTLLTNGGVTNTDHILGLSAVDADHVWAIGGQETFLYSTNGGAYWDTYHHGTIKDGNEIYTHGTNLVLAVCDATVYWSSDNGVTWTNHDLWEYSMDVSAPDGTNIWVVRNNYDGGQIYHSPDGGLTWTSQFQNADYGGLFTVSMQQRSQIYPAGTRFVWTNSPSPTPPFTNWHTAAHVIQEAVDIAAAGDTVLVAEGIHDSGGRVAPGESLTNRVCMTNRVTLAGDGAPSNTFIMGAADPVTTNGPAAVRCVRMTTNAVLDGFVLLGGHTHTNSTVLNDLHGGGAQLDGGARVTNCAMIGCSADGDGGGVHCRDGTLIDCQVSGNSAEYGGGVALAGEGLVVNCLVSGNLAFGGGGVNCAISGDTARNCLITDNTATHYGGGAIFLYGGTLDNCTIRGNSAEIGGGAYALFYGELNNCIVWGNSNMDISGITPRYTCASDGSEVNGCITNNPQFVDTIAGNFRLMSNSPCLDMGITQSWMSGATDLDGNPRISHGYPDMGAYEFTGVVQGADADGDGLENADERGVYLTDPTNPDTDGDRMGDGNEVFADTIPTDSNSYFHLTGVDHTNSCTVTFVCTNSRVYSLQSATNMVNGEWLMVDGQTNVPGDAGGTTTLIDTNPPGADAIKTYRVGVALP